MPAMIIKHRVADFDTWHKIYQQHSAMRSAAGTLSSIVSQSENDPNQVTIFFEVESLDRAREFLGSEDLAQTMTGAGVLDQPSVEFLGSVQRYPS